MKSATIVNSINNYVLQNGRVVNFKIGAHSGVLLASKHENSVSYDQSLKLAAASKGPSAVLVIVDSISRKYFTSETSWLWDINFDLLKGDNISSVILSGKYANDLAARFSYSEVENAKLYVVEDIGEAVGYLKDNGDEYIYVITCFADKDKLLSKVNII